MVLVGETVNVLVVAAHPDDEVLGCGGVLAKHAAAGDEVQVAILAEGVTSRDPIRSPEQRGEELVALAASARQAHQILGSASVTLHDFPDNRMDSLDLLEVVQFVESLIVHQRPQVVYTHHGGDLNIDHRCVHQAVVTACRPFPGQCVRRLLFFEVASSSEWQPPGSAEMFHPNWFVDISDTLERKLTALGAYHSELRPWPHPRSLLSVEHLARWRGSSVGVEAAEAFVLGRILA